MNLAPVVIFAYNRPLHLQKTIEALKKNSLSSDSDLFIFCDGNKNENDKNLVEQVKNFVKQITGFKSITIFEREKNFGLSKSIIDGVTKIVNIYGKVIVLEDDLISSPYYLKFINDALDLYEYDEEVISVQGYVYPVKEGLPECFFIQGADCQGWATWKRGWNLFEEDGKKLLKKLQSKRLIKDFNFNNSYSYDKMLKQQIKGRISSWAIRWYASAYLENKYTLYPGKTLIYNIGFGTSGTNTQNKYLSEKFNSEINILPINLTRITIENSKNGRRSFELFFKRNQYWRNPRMLLYKIYKILIKSFIK